MRITSRTYVLPCHHPIDLSPKSAGSVPLPSPGERAVASAAGSVERRRTHHDGSLLQLAWQILEPTGRKGVCEKENSATVAKSVYLRVTLPPQERCAHGASPFCAASLFLISGSSSGCILRCCVPSNSSHSQLAARWSATPSSALGHRDCAILSSLRVGASKFKNRRGPVPARH